MINEFFEGLRSLSFLQGGALLLGIYLFSRWRPITIIKAIGGGATNNVR